METLRRSADIMVTLCGTPGRTGWMGLRFCCPWCGFAPVGEQGWIVLDNAGPRRLIPMAHLTADQRKRWARLENDRNHREDVEEFFSTDKSSGWICAACGDEYPMAAQDTEAYPQMLLSVLRGPDKEADMVLYRTQMPRGVAANLVHALKLANALVDGRRREVLQTMGTPNEQTAQEFAGELIRLLDDCTAVSRVCTGQVLREQARSTEVKKPRKLATGLRHRLHGVCIHTIPGLTLRAGEIGSVRPFWAIRATRIERTQSTDEGQGWDEILELILKHLTAREVIGLCQLTPADVRQDTTRNEVENRGSAILPYLEDREKGLTDLCPTLRRLVEGCRLGWATMLPEQEMGRGTSGDEGHGNLSAMQAFSNTLRVIWRRGEVGRSSGPNFWMSSGRGSKRSCK